MIWLACLYLTCVLTALWVTRPRPKRFTVHVAQGRVEQWIDSAALVQVLAKRNAAND